MVNTVAYQFDSISGVSSLIKGGVLMDSAPQHSQPLSLHLKALIQSGDYFAEVATQLDTLCAEPATPDATITRLQRIVNELLQLQEHYRIIAK